jgi:hypothetical protein
MNSNCKSDEHRICRSTVNMTYMQEEKITSSKVIFFSFRPTGIQKTRKSHDLDMRPIAFYALESNLSSSNAHADAACFGWANSSAWHKAVINGNAWVAAAKPNHTDRRAPRR